MQNLQKYLTNGLKNTLLFKNNSGISHKGPWKQVYENTLLDRWHVGEFSSVEYTISADLDTNNKEIIKALITATDDRASVVVYARNHTLRELVTIDPVVNNSYVDVILNPADSLPTGQNDGTKVIFTAQYFHTLTPLSR